MVIKAVSQSPEALKPGICPLDNKPVLGLLSVVPVQMEFVGVLPFLRIWGSRRFWQKIYCEPFRPCLS